MALYCNLRFDVTRRKSAQNILYHLRNVTKTSSCIQKLFTENDREISNPEHIRKEIKSFYENPYKKIFKTERECLEYLARINARHLLKNDKTSCEGKLTLQNIWKYEKLRNI